MKKAGNEQNAISQVLAQLGLSHPLSQTDLNSLRSLLNQIEPDSPAGKLLSGLLKSLGKLETDGKACEDSGSVLDSQMLHDKESEFNPNSSNGLALTKIQTKFASPDVEENALMMKQFQRFLQLNGNIELDFIRGPDGRLVISFKNGPQSQELIQTLWRRFHGMQPYQQCLFSRFIASLARIARQSQDQHPLLMLQFVGDGNNNSQKISSKQYQLLEQLFDENGNLKQESLELLDQLLATNDPRQVRAMVDMIFGSANNELKVRKYRKTFSLD